MSGEEPSAFANDSSVSSQLAGTDFANLYGVIDKDNVHGLNLDIPEQARDIIKAWDEREDTGRFADSGVDDQKALIYASAGDYTCAIYPECPCEVVATQVRGESTPRHLRIYANHPSIIDFSDAESTTPQLDISLLDGQVEVTEYPLRVAAFANINSLSLFFSESMGGERSRIFYIGFKGDMTNPQKDIRQKIDLPAANAADAPLVDKVTQKAASQNTVR